MVAINFRQLSHPRLYLADCDDQNVGGVQPCVALLLPPDADTTSMTIGLVESWMRYSTGCYVFLNEPLSTDQEAPFATALTAILSDRSRAGTRFIWAANPNHAASGLFGHWLAVTHDADNTVYTQRVTVFDIRNIAVLIGRGCVVTVNDDGFVFTPPHHDRIVLQVWDGTVRLENVTDALLLPVCGAESGCLQFPMELTSDAYAPDANGGMVKVKESDFCYLDVGLRVFFPYQYPLTPRADGESETTFDARQSQLALFNDVEGDFLIDSQRYPIFEEQGAVIEDVRQRLTAQGKPAPARVIPVTANLDPLAPLEADRTYFAFQPGVEMVSHFHSNLGYTMHLTTQDNSRLVFAEKPVSDQAPYPAPVYLVPQGDFALGVPRYSANSSMADDNLICGLSGVEYIKLDYEKVTLLRFMPGQAAYAPDFRSGKPMTQTAAGEALNTFATTSWAYVCYEQSPQDDVPVYFAQPEQAVLHRVYSAALARTKTQPPAEFLHYMEAPAAPLPLTTDGDTPLAFPLFPYGGVDEGNLVDYTTVELQILNPLRRKRIFEITRDSANNLLLTHANGQAPYTGTTPQGLLATFSGDYDSIQRLLLAKYKDNGRTGELTFEDIGRKTPLRAAIQSNQLFMVISDPFAIEAFFKQNDLTMAGWTFELDPQQLIPTEPPSDQVNLDPTDPKNREWNRLDTVLIFKFYDKPLAELVNNTNMWSQASAFNSNPRGTRRKLKRLVDDVITKGGLAANPKDQMNYGGLARAFQNPEWSGIVAFNVKVPFQGLPDELAGLAAGIDERKFYAQYVGVDTTPVLNVGGQLQAQPSSLFGLIDYNDDAPPPPNDSGYNFKVRSLSVLFRNSQIKNFACEILVTLDKLFEEATRLHTSPTGRNDVLLKGRYETHNGVGSYSFTFSGSNRFLLPGSAILNDIEIIRAQFITLAANNDAVSSRFSFLGRFNFRRLEKFDAFGFGADEGAAPGDPTPQYLSFSNLNLDMRYRWEDTTDQTFEFRPGDLLPDKATSISRPHSLYAHFPLKLTGFVASTGGQPGDRGYMPVSSPLPGGSMGDVWYGLAYDLELGSVGSLAGKAGITVRLITAWTPGAKQVYIGLRLPGSSGGKKEITIQGVIKIVFKRIEFVVGEERDTNGTLTGATYLLKLKNIALKFLTLSIPPGGQTEIIIFGDPDGTPENSSVGWYAAYAKDQP